MPITNSIAKLFELEDIVLKDVVTTNDEVHVFFSLQRKIHTCPFCNTLTDKVHDYRTSVIKDLPFMGKKCFLHYRKRRYHCPCCNKHFYENFPLLPKYCRITTRLAFYSIHLLGNRQSIRSVASLLGISDSFIFRRMKDISYPKPSQLPKFFPLTNFVVMPADKNFRQSLQMQKIINFLIFCQPVLKLTLCYIYKVFQTKNR